MYRRNGLAAMALSQHSDSPSWHELNNQTRQFLSFFMTVNAMISNIPNSINCGYKYRYRVIFISRRIYAGNMNPGQRQSIRWFVERFLGRLNDHSQLQIIEAYVHHFLCSLGASGYTVLIIYQHLWQSTSVWFGSHL